MKNLLSKTVNSLDEILFENRNKAYGAYALRQDSDVLLTKALVLGIASAVALAVVPLVINNFLQTQGNTTVIGCEFPVIELEDMSGFTDIDKVVAPIAPPKVEDVKTFDSTVPTPTRNPKKEKPAARVEDYQNAVAGFENKGTIEPITYQPDVPNVSKIDVPVVAPPKVENPNAIVENVDVEASFSGGIDAFRNKVVGSFDVSSFEGTDAVIKTTVTFIVEKDGTISNIKANGVDAIFNKEAEKTIKNIKGRWNPATVDGKPVRSYFRFPISMKFE